MPKLTSNLCLYLALSMSLSYVDLEFAVFLQYSEQTISGGGGEIYEVMQQNVFSLAFPFLLTIPKASLCDVHHFGIRRWQRQPGVGRDGCGGPGAPPPLPGARVAGAGAARWWSPLSAVHGPDETAHGPTGRERPANLRCPSHGERSSSCCCHCFPDFLQGFPDFFQGFPDFLQGFSAVC